MNLFAWLLVGHLVGDFLFQTAWMARNKSKHRLALFVHCSVYTGCVFLLSLFEGGLSLYGTALIFIGHIILDQRIWVDFWAKHVTKSESLPWLKIVQDQAWHILLLAIAVYL